MKRLKLLAGIGLLVAAMATPSLAADLPRPAYKAPVYAPPAAFSWSGLYVGINGGYGWGRSTWTGPAGTTAFNTRGWMAGGTVGYNIQTGSIVWGIEGDLDWTDVRGNAVGACGNCTTRMLWLGTVRGRVGYAFNSFLPYITGGAAFNSSWSGTAATGATARDTVVGWTIGAGLEYAFMGAWSAKVEYLYMDFQNARCPATACTVATTVDNTLHNVRVGLNYRF
ncbi:MAG: porin family protein [Pseudolabrys sp.]|nr:porin family protein [Pseudolabrys sp.]